MLCHLNLFSQMQYISTNKKVMKMKNTLVCKHVYLNKQAPITFWKLHKFDHFSDKNCIMYMYFCFVKNHIFIRNLKRNKWVNCRICDCGSLCIDTHSAFFRICLSSLNKIRQPILGISPCIVTIFSTLTRIFVCKITKNSNFKSLE